MSDVANDGHENVAIFNKKRLTAQEIMLHSHTVAFPLFLQTRYIRNTAED